MAAIAYPTTSDRRPRRAPLRLVEPDHGQFRGSRSRHTGGPSTGRRRVVYRRRRLLVGGLVIVAVLALVGAVTAVHAAMGAFGGGPLTSPETPVVRAQPVVASTYVVRPGDTLWSIAKSVHPSGDLRPYVDRLAARLHGQPLQPGEHIPLP